MKDEEILDLYWDRNENAITATAEKYGRYCHSISYNILHSHEDAEECVNDTYLGAWKSIPPRRPQLLSAYLGKITRNLSLNRFKQYTTQKRGLGQIPLLLSELTDCIPAATGPEQHADDMFLAESISAFLCEQPRLKRDLFIREAPFMRMEDIPLPEGAVSAYDDLEIYHMYFQMEDGLTVHLRLFEGGYVRFDGIRGVCVRIPEEAFQEMTAEFAGKQD